MEKVSFEPGMK